MEPVGHAGMAPVSPAAFDGDARHLHLYKTFKGNLGFRAKCLGIWTPKAAHRDAQLALLNAPGPASAVVLDLQEWDVNKANLQSFWEKSTVGLQGEALTWFQDSSEMHTIITSSETDPLFLRKMIELMDKKWLGEDMSRSIEAALVSLPGRNESVSQWMQRTLRTFQSVPTAKLAELIFMLTTASKIDQFDSEAAKQLRSNRLSSFANSQAFMSAVEALIPSGILSAPQTPEVAPESAKIAAAKVGGNEEKPVCSFCKKKGDRYISDTFTRFLFQSPRGARGIASH